MRPLTAETLRGVWATLLLPLNADDSIDYSRLDAQAAVLSSSRLDGLYAHGTAGEFQTLSEDEFDRVNEVLAGAGKPFQIGASHPSAQVQLARVRRAAEFQPGAIQVIVPDWLPLNDREVLDFLRRTADASDGVPLVLYNPPHAKTQVGPQLLAELARVVPELIGLKTAGGDKRWFDEATKSGLSIFVPGHFLASMSLLGAHGSYSNVAALSPNGSVRWARDLEVERRIGEFFGQHIAPLQKAGLSNPALDKFLAAVGGWADVGTRVRWPMTSATQADVEAARPVVRRLVPELFGDS
ncbi:dihydrodipicolinate synthase/N-acetylneuraminate lyase [Kribbella antiqua]|uniref:Dihydrodipicolinate synthase/N-acetylneuraminate lyase n=1 Tax=Kribbella antiqua TaxID=2512217 RepID=A0A4R2J1I4_9ACTN|nr:dihydrodipicolinate synthase family protein [Kribbella antiqua]TCO51607.1 dihydrodipicolinate synthase/N-acetylneuraminate lyase [Kribbella antiqua]